LYKQRWQVELFFKWVKQHLHIESFFGYSQNAVKTQIWIALSTYLLITIFKKQANLQAPLSQILHFLSDILYEQSPIQEVFQELSPKTTTDTGQLFLFNNQLKS
jgi:IS4 transposase